MAKQKQVKNVKITVILPEKLLQRALNSTAGNITEAVRQGLQLLAASQAYGKLQNYRGTVSTSIDLKELRSDRKW
mgnify:CR=1 FL=1